MIKVHLRKIYASVKECCYHLLSLFSKGNSFEALSCHYLEQFSSCFPPRLQYPTKLFFVYVFIHLYLLYILCACLASIFYKETKIRGTKLFPALPGLKDKLTIWVTSFFVFHWLSGALFEPGWSFLTDWVFAIRPQINIKPQVKVLQQTSSSVSMSSTISFSMEDPSAGLDVGMEPEEPSTQQLLRFVGATRRTIGSANDLYHSMASDASSNESMISSSDED